MKWPLLRGQCCQHIPARAVSGAQPLHRVTLRTWAGATAGQPSEEEEVAGHWSHLKGKEAWCCVSFYPSTRLGARFPQIQACLGARGRVRTASRVLGSLASAHQLVSCNLRPVFS